MADDGVRVVTELRVRRETEALTRPALADELRAMDRQAAGLDARSVQEWESRRYAPCALYRRLLCERFHVASIAELGLGDRPEAARWWTRATRDQTRLEVYRRRIAALGVEPFGVPLLPLDPRDAQLTGEH